MSTIQATIGSLLVVTREVLTQALVEDLFLGQTGLTSLQVVMTDVQRSFGDDSSLQELVAISFEIGQLLERKGLAILSSGDEEMIYDL